MHRSRAGFTLIEALVAVSVAALILGNVAVMLSASNTGYEKESSRATLELQLDQTLDRITLALMSADLNSLNPGAPNPAFHTQLEFEQRLGVQNGVVVRGDPERIEYTLAAGEVVWKQRPEQENERSVVWNRWVRQFLEGELPNGVDDNGNGLVDESGLTFIIEGASVTIWLSLERIGPENKPVTYSRKAVITCRNT